MSWSPHGDGEEMTVNELIENLKKFDGDLRVGIDSAGGYTSYIAAFVKSETSDGTILEICVGDCVYAE